MTIDVKQIMQRYPPAPEMQVTLANWREPALSRWAFSHVRQIMPTAPIAAPEQPADMQHAIQYLSALDVSMGAAPVTLCGWLETSQTDAFLVMHRGKLVFEWFGGWGAADRQHIIFSVSKSLTALLAGILCEAGILDPQRAVRDYLPEGVGSAY